MMTVDLRASNAKATAELAWGPAFRTYRERITRLAHVLPAPTLRGRGSERA